MSASRFDLGVIDVVEFLGSLGVHNIRKEMREVRFSCPYPVHSMGDRDPSAYMNQETTAFHCFGCGASGNAITFLADVREVSRATAREWIMEKWAPQFADIEDLHGFVKRMMEEIEQDQGEQLAPAVLDDVESEKRWTDWSASSRDPWAHYMHARGFSPEILNRFELGYDDASNRITIPVRLPTHELVGFKGRIWHSSQDGQPKYMVLGDTEQMLAQGRYVYGFAPYDAAQFVFGANHARVIDRTLIVREGELNVVSMHQKGFENTVGPSGSTLSDKQIAEIARMADRVILFFDSDMQNEQSATTAQIKLLRAIDQFDSLCDVLVCQDHDGDPAEMSAEEIRKLVDNAQSSTYYRALHLMQSR